MNNQLSAEQLASALDLKKKGNSFRGACPHHGGSSFEITEKGGKVLLHCFSGCFNSDIIKELQERRLWPKGKQKPRTGPSEAAIKHAQTVCMIASADIDAGKDISDQDRQAMLKSAAIVKGNYRATFGGLMARRCLPAIDTWEASNDL